MRDAVVRELHRASVDAMKADRSGRIKNADGGRALHAGRIPLALRSAPGLR